MQEKLESLSNKNENRLEFAPNFNNPNEKNNFHTAGSDN